VTGVVTGSGPLPKSNMSKELAHLENQLWPRGFGRDVWMLVDSARDPQIYGLLLECFYSDHTCLFSGELSPQLQLSAPYLVFLEYEDAKTRKFLSRAWGNNWGVLLRSNAGVKRLTRHLRGLLVVRDERGTKLMFRYYDARVLRVYLPTCTANELQTVFGPIEAFFMEDETPGSILSFQIEERRLIERKL
jgi:hypothetical protein